jgi:hypothetical protein
MRELGPGQIGLVDARGLFLMAQGADGRGIVAGVAQDRADQILDVEGLETRPSIPPTRSRCPPDRPPPREDRRAGMAPRAADAVEGIVAVEHRHLEVHQMMSKAFALSSAMSTACWPLVAVLTCAEIPSRGCARRCRG